MSERLPSVAGERLSALRAAARDWAKDGTIDSTERARIDGRTVPAWRSNRLPLAATFFVLTLLAVAAVWMLLRVLELPLPGLLTGSIALVLAEVLIVRGRFFGSGIESALWIGGLVAMITALPSTGAPEALLVFAAAFALAGVRVRSAFSGALAAVCTIVYVSVKADTPGVTLVFAVAIAFTAALALLHEFRRPSTELLWIALLLVSPAAGTVTDRFRGDRGNPDSLWIPLCLLSAVLFAVAVRTRLRVLFAGGALSLALGVWNLSETIDAPAEVTLIVSGALLLAASAAFSRLLRGRTSGFVVTPASAFRYDEVVQIAGTIAAHPSRPESPPPGPQGGGGSFGGAGASGEY